MYEVLCSDCTWESTQLHLGITVVVLGEVAEFGYAREHKRTINTLEIVGNTSRGQDDHSSGDLQVLSRKFLVNTRTYSTRMVVVCATCKVQYVLEVGSQ
jgi:hypothetical protein